MEEELFQANDEFREPDMMYPPSGIFLVLRAIVICIFLVVSLGLMVFAFKMDTEQQKPNYPSYFQKGWIKLPSFEEDVLLCSSASKMEYDGELSLVSAIQVGDPYRPFLFEYQLEGHSGLLQIDEHPDFSDPWDYPLSERDTSVAIDNLKVNTTYHYRVIVEDQEYSGTFRTAPSTRFVYIPGLVNTRDIGGYVTQDGKTVKQGLLVRGVEMDGLINVSYYIPREELENVQKSFGFVYDMDLRTPSVYYGEYQSRLNIPHKFYSSPQYGEIFAPAYQEVLRQIFADLADPDKYPMYLHCTWGRDRTGTIVFLLQGVLNMSEEAMIREYCLSAYTHPNLAESRNMDVIIDRMAAMPGNTLQEQIVYYLTEEVGVTQAEIASIRRIFLEETAAP